MKLIKKDGRWIRPRPCTDDVTLAEIRSYRQLEIGPKDTVLDVGGHIGLFSAVALEAGATVIGVEPHPDNQKIYRRNAPRAKLYAAACVADRRLSVTLYRSTTSSHGIHTIVPTRGRDPLVVPTVNFSALLRLHKPTVIKMDCEGAELELLDRRWLPRSLKQLAVEWHLQKKDARRRCRALHRSLLEQGFKSLRKVTFDTGAWTQVGVYRR